MYKTSAAKLTLAYNALAPYITFSLLMQQNSCSVSLCFQDCLFIGSPMYMLERLQKVQNSATRLIFQCCKQNHISPLLMSLHWLPLKARIEYKLSVICHSFFFGLSPIYLTDLLSVYTPKGNLCSFDNRILCISKLQTKSFLHHIFFCSPHENGIHFLQNSGILILSRNLSQRKNSSFC